MEYLDTGSRDPAQTLHAWLASTLPQARFFGCQTGYFTADALFAFETHVRAILDIGGEVRLVIGGNEDALAADDLNDALDLLEPFPQQASIVVVSALDVLVHAKTFYIEHVDGSRAALVGSANLTGSGLGANIEACLAVSSASESKAPYDEIKSAIEAWRVAGRPNARLLDRKLVPQLATTAVVPKPPRVPSQSRASLRRLFPPLGRIVTIPTRRRRRRAIGTPAARARRVRLVPGSPFPPGVVGIVKRLSSLDTKGFRGAKGTLYVAMPSDLLPLIPTSPFGVNGEPRMDLTLEARHASVLGQTVVSGASPTNITGVGYGTGGASHKDVRLNVLRVTVAGIEYIAARAGAQVPRTGDYLFVEFPQGGNSGRLTFIVEGPFKRRAAQLCRASSWAWLPDGISPPW